jgi:hypothetical protein
VRAIQMNRLNPAGWAAAWPPSVYRPSSEESACRRNDHRDDGEHGQSHLGHAPVDTRPRRCQKERPGHDARQDPDDDPRHGGGDGPSHIVIVGRRRPGDNPRFRACRSPFSASDERHATGRRIRRVDEEHTAKRSVRRVSWAVRSDRRRGFDSRDTCRMGRSAIARPSRLSTASLV